MSNLKHEKFARERLRTCGTLELLFVEVMLCCHGLVGLRELDLKCIEALERVLVYGLRTAACLTLHPHVGPSRACDVVPSLSIFTVTTSP